MFLLAQMRKMENLGFDALAGLFKSKMAAEIAKKIQLAKKQSSSFGTAKLRAKVTEHCRRSLNDRACVASFLETWRAKALFQKGMMGFRL
jgi:hypothetical protein